MDEHPLAEATEHRYKRQYESHSRDHQGCARNPTFAPPYFCQSDGMPRFIPCADVRVVVQMMRRHVTRYLFRHVELTKIADQNCAVLAPETLTLTDLYPPAVPLRRPQITAPFRLRWSRIISAHIIAPSIVTQIGVSASLFTVTTRSWPAVVIPRVPSSLVTSMVPGPDMTINRPSPASPFSSRATRSLILLMPYPSLLMPRSAAQGRKSPRSTCAPSAAPSPDQPHPV